MEQELLQADTNRGFVSVNFLFFSVFSFSSLYTSGCLKYNKPGSKLLCEGCGGSELLCHKENKVLE